jgi:hypothetical protein
MPTDSGESFPITEQSVTGLLSAIETLQEILIASKLTTPERLAKMYDLDAQRYFHAHMAEAASVLAVLIHRLEDEQRSQKRLLIYGKPQGSA